MNHTNTHHVQKYKTGSWKSNLFTTSMPHLLYFCINGSQKFMKPDKTKTSKIATTNLWIVSNFIEKFTNLNHWGFSMTQDKTTYCNKSGFTCSPSIRTRYVHYTTKNNQSEGRIQIKPLPCYNHCLNRHWVLFQKHIPFLDRGTEKLANLLLVQCVHSHSWRNKLNVVFQSFLMERYILVSKRYMLSILCTKFHKYRNWTYSGKGTLLNS